MKRTGKFLTILCMLAACMLVLSVLGCKGGGSGSSGQVAGTEGSASGYGKVGVLLTDCPTDEYDHIWVTVTEVSLLPTGDSEDKDAVVIFSSAEGYEFDLLQYRDNDFLLKLNEAVPVGKYEKIRLVISEVRTEGGPCDNKDIKVPSGKIDLNPSGSIEVTENSTLYIRLDIDANKSFVLDEKGSSGKCIFRPVVSVYILAKESFPTCPIFVSGTIDAVADRDTDGIPESFTLSRDYSCMGKMKVNTDDETALFFGTPADIKPGQYVMVRGMVGEEGFNASMIVIGETLSIKGVVKEPVSDTGFDLTPDTGEAITGTLTVALDKVTPVVKGCDEPGSIAVGLKVEVVGRYDVETKKLYAAIVILKPEETSGIITSVVQIDAACPEKGFIFTVDRGDSGSENVTVCGNFILMIEGDGLLEPATVPYLDLKGCRISIVEGINLTEVTLIPLSFEGDVESRYNDSAGSKLLIVSGTKVCVMPEATGVDIVGEEIGLIPFADIEIGYGITCFGFNGAESGTVGFYAFAYVIDD